MFESHITISDCTEAEFLLICAKIGSKPVLIKDDTGSRVNQLMTANFHRTKYAERAIEQMHLIASNFTSIVRQKLEYIQAKNELPPPCIYVEIHSKYLVHEDRLGTFLDAVKSCGGQSSRNAFKPAGSGFQHRFATTRSDESHSRLLTLLSDFKRVSTIRECVIYDDNQSLDANWACMECPIKRIA